MSDTKYVLCVSDDAEVRERLARPLEWSYPQLTVLTAPGFEAAVEYIQREDLDCVVSDYETVDRSPRILQAIRERHPGLPLLMVTEYATDGGGGTTVAEVVDFLDGVGEPGSDEAFAGWVANAVVRSPGDVSPPGGNRPEDIVRDVKQALVDATTPMDIEHAVCDQLTMGGRYTFAWIGEFDRGEQQVVPWVSGSAVDGWPVSRTFSVGTGPIQSVVERALRTRQTQAVDDVTAHPLDVPWADAAAEHGCTAACLVPLTSDDELYGVFGVFSDRADGFGEMEVGALEEIGDTVANVLHTMALRGRVDQQERVLQRYERLVETVGDGMYSLDAEGHFMTVNRGLLAMTGYTREGLLGEHVSIVMDEEDIELGEEVIRTLLSSGNDEEATAMEMDVYAKDGTAIPCENQVAIMTDDDGEFNGTVGVVRDVTERRKREQELERQNERLEAFAEIVSHDLRNPLSVAQGYLDLAQEGGSTDRLDNVADALERMEDIIGDVLALARHGQTVTETETVDLGEIVTEAWGNVATESATLSVADSVTVAADRSRMLRLLENLFRNAVEHAGEDVAVEVGVLEEGPPEADAGPATEPVGAAAAAESRFEFDHGLEETGAPEPVEPGESDRSAGFYVADDGPGIPASIREHAFESSFTTSEEGLGLGLWVVREVASAHGWRTDATESESGGARFEFRDVQRP